MLRQVRVKTLCVLIFLLAACFFLFGFKNPGSALSGQLFVSQMKDGSPAKTNTPGATEELKMPARQQPQNVPPRPATEAVTRRPLEPLANETRVKPVKYTSIEDQVEYWRSHSKETGNLPDEAELKALSAKDVQLYFHSYLDNADTLCQRTIRLGTIFNGGYRVCDDEEYRPRVPCTVYSFGMKTDYVVEDEFAKLYGCHVYYFDPSLEENPRNRSERVSLWRLGLGGKEGELEPAMAKERDAKHWTSRSLTDIKAQLGHKEVTLDVVKLDINGWEWSALADMAASGELDRVRQLIVELHNFGGSKAEVTRGRLAVLRAVEKAGFRMFSSNLDEWAGEKHSGVYPVLRTSTYEVCYVNSRLARTDTAPRQDSTLPLAQDKGQPLPGIVNMEFLRAHGKERGGLPDEEQIEALSDKEVHYAYHSFLDNVQYQCKRSIKLGQLVDGGYRVCDDPAFRPQKPCLFYSFGIRNDFSFDDAAARAYGCEVHSFDPSMNVPSHRHSMKVTYHRLGLGGWGGQLEGQGAQLEAKHHWRVESLADIKALLGHQDRILDVVKIDIEGSEWISLANMAQSGELSRIRQLIMEFHIFDGNNAEAMRRHLAVVGMVEKAGFRVFYTWQYAGWPGIQRLKDVYPVLRTVCYETSFVNVNLARP